MPRGETSVSGLGPADVTVSTAATDRTGRPQRPDRPELAPFMSEVGRILGESLDFETTLRQVATIAVPRVADWCAVELLTEDGELTELALVHQEPATVHVVNELRRLYPADPNRNEGAWAVIRSGRSLLVPEITTERLRAKAVDERHEALLLQLSLRSYICVPLRSGGRVLGALSLATEQGGRRFDAKDLALAEDLATRAASAIENARAFRTADRFRRILDAVAEAVLVLDPADGRIRDVNRGALDLFGAPREELLGQRLWSLVEGWTPEDVQRLVDSVVDREVESRTITLMMIQSSGRRVPVEVLIQRVELPGESGGLVAIARDIRERVDAQVRLQRLAEAEHARAAELNAVIRAMGEGMVVCTRVGEITLANPAARELFGDALERGYAGIIDELQDAEPVPVLGQHGGPIAFGLRRDPDRWVEVSTYPVADRRIDEHDGGETIVVFRDVTEARQREAVRETFIGVLSHELRTPVTTIFGGAKILARQDGRLDAATERSIFLDIAAEAERLQRLVEDVVALNRFGEDDGELGDEPVLLQRVVPTVVRSEESRWPGVTFTIDVPPGLPTVVADPTYVEQVVRNLLSNAAKYGGAGATVDVVLERAEAEVEVRILDDGPGILPDEASNLFELFYRSSDTAATTSGAGIGLFVCARLVRAMGGRIWAFPRPAGGAEFGFALRVMDDD